MCVIQQKGLGDIGLGGNEVLGSCEERGTKGGSLKAEGNSGPPAMCLLGQGPQVEPPAAELAQAQDNTSLGEGNFLLRESPNLEFQLEELRTGLSVTLGLLELWLRLVSLGDS